MIKTAPQSKFPLAIVVLFATFFVSGMESSAQVHYWNRTSGLPGWHSSGNWSGGIPSPGAVAYFRNATNGTVYINSSTGLLTAVQFGLTSSGASNVYAKFRGNNGHGLFANNIFVGANSDRTAFVDLDRGNHQVLSLFKVLEESRLDVRAASTVQAPIFQANGSVNNYGTITASQQFRIDDWRGSLNNQGTVATDIGFVTSGSITNSGTFNASSYLWLEDYADFTSNGGSLTTGTVISTEFVDIDWNSGVLNTQKLTVDRGSNFVMDGGTINANSVIWLSNDGSLEFNGGQINAASLRFTSEFTNDLTVASGRTLNISGDIYGGESTNGNDFRGRANFDGAGTVDAQGDIVLFDASLSIGNGTLRANGVTEGALFEDNNVFSRGLSVYSGGLLDVGDMEFNGDFKGLNAFVNAATIQSDNVIMRGEGADKGKISIWNNGSWTNTNSFHLGKGTGHAKMEIDGGGSFQTASMQIGESGGAAGYVDLLEGTFDITGELDIQAGYLWQQNGLGISNVGSLSVRGSNSPTYEYGDLFVDAGTFDVANETRIYDGGYVGSALSGTFTTQGLLVEGGWANSWQSGEFNVSGVAQVDDDGLVTASEGGSINIAQQLVVGDASGATLDVYDGGILNSQSAAIAKQAGSNATATVQGTGSIWTNEGNLSVGGDASNSGGSGNLSIFDGGLVVVGQTLKVWSGGTVDLDGGSLEVGTLDLSEASASFNFVSGTLVADNLTGDLVQTDGVLAPGDSPGLTSINGDYTMNAGSIEFEIGGLIRELEYDGVDVTGTFTAFGTLDVDFINGFNPLAGDSFLLVDAGSYSGLPVLDLSGAVLDEGLLWDTSNFGFDGTISVIAAVPEPASIVVVGLLGLVATSRRKRI